MLGALRQKNDNDEWQAIAFCSFYRKGTKATNCRFQEREATFYALEEFSQYFEDQSLTIMHKHSGLDFLLIWPLCHRLHRVGHLYLYKSILDEYHETAGHIEFEGDYTTSKHEVNVDCFTKQESYDQEVDQLYFSDSD